MDESVAMEGSCIGSTIVLDGAPAVAQARGLGGVKLVISDARTGLISAMETVFAGSAWQPRRAHFIRNVLSNVPKTSGPMVASIIWTIFAQPDTEHVFSSGIGQLAR